jgi:hypothetical protein
MLQVYLVILVYVFSEFLDEGYHVAVIDLVGEIVHLQLQDCTWVLVLAELCVVTPEDGLVLSRGLNLLIVQLDDLRFAENLTFGRFQ